MLTPLLDVKIPPPRLYRISVISLRGGCLQDKAIVNRVDFIDALRGIAAFIIIIFHLDLLPQPNLEVPALLDKFIRLGGSGVILFFVISAFSLYLSLDNKKNEKGNFLIKFYLRRLFRIVPLFYFMLAFYVIITYTLFHSSITKEQLLSNLMFAFNLHPLYVESLVWAGWTIGVLMIFYLFMPLIYSNINSFHKSIFFAISTIILSYIFDQFLKFNLTFNQDLIDEYVYMNFINQLRISSNLLIEIFKY